MKHFNYFECDKCGKRFENKKSCLEHENNCFQKMPLKAILCKNFITLPKEGLEIIIHEYYDSYILGDQVCFYEKDYEYNIMPSLNSLCLDKVKTDDNNDFFVIYTTDFSKKHEKECIEKILNERKKYYQKSLEEYEKECMKIIKGKEKIFTTRVKNPKYRIECYSDDNY